MLKLNLGSGMKPFLDHVNIDFDDNYDCDLKLDLAREPLPYNDDTVDVIKCYHLLEHLDYAGFNWLLKEMYRVLKPGHEAWVVVPGHRHNLYLDDPTHVRPVNPGMMVLYSQSHFRHAFEKVGHILTPYWRSLGVDFNVLNIAVAVDPKLPDELRNNQTALHVATHFQNNVVMEHHFKLEAVKPFNDLGNPEGMDAFCTRKEDDNDNDPDNLWNRNDKQYSYRTYNKERGE